jgi:hypothetical protein
MDSSHTPEQLLNRFDRPLLLGIGGGYDIFAGLPVFLDFFAKSKNPVLANLSFTRDLDRKARSKDKAAPPFCFPVRASEYESDAFSEKLGFPDNYFPEFHLSKWMLHEHNWDHPIHAIQLIHTPNANEQLGVANYSQTLSNIIDCFQCDAIILIDAGVDSVVLGDEEGLGTYAEDFLSMMAATSLGWQGIQ